MKIPDILLQRPLEQSSDMTKPGASLPFHLEVIPKWRRQSVPGSWTGLYGEALEGHCQQLVSRCYDSHSIEGNAEAQGASYLCFTEHNKTRGLEFRSLDLGLLGICLLEAVCLADKSICPGLVSLNSNLGFAIY